MQDTRLVFEARLHLDLAKSFIGTHFGTIC